MAEGWREPGSTSSLFSSKTSKELLLLAGRREAAEIPRHSQHLIWGLQAWAIQLAEVVNLAQHQSRPGKRQVSRSVEEGSWGVPCPAPLRSTHF